MYLLEIIAFISGAVILILELVGSRIIAPYLGTSIFVWTSLIGVILGSLSLGYYFGGKLADRTPSHRNLSYMLFLSGISLLVTAFIDQMVLSGVQNATKNLRFGAVIATTILFAPPSILIAMTVPYVVRLKMKTVDQSGATVGTLYSISTVGSIFGTFIAGFFLIAYLGSSQIIYVLAIVMMATSIAAYVRGFRELLILSLFATPFLIGVRNIGSLFNTSHLADVDTEYNRVSIIDSIDSAGDPIRYMKINDDTSSAAYLNRQDLCFAYTRYYLLSAHFQKHMKRCLMLGGAAYSFPKFFLNRFPDAEIDVVEIDPGLTRLAQKYFGLRSDPRMRIVHEDGRTFLNRTREKYDVIFVDVFKSLFSLPAHLTTVEAASQMERILQPDGLVMVNVISSIQGDSGKFFRAEYATYQRRFHHLAVFAVQEPKDPRRVQNLMLVAFKNEPSEDVWTSSNDPEINEFLQHRSKSEVQFDLPPLTDDYSPVEIYSLSAVDQRLGH